MVGDAMYTACKQGNEFCAHVPN